MYVQLNCYLTEYLYQFTLTARARKTSALEYLIRVLGCNSQARKPLGLNVSYRLTNHHRPTKFAMLMCTH